MIRSVRRFLFFWPQHAVEGRSVSLPPPCSLMIPRAQSLLPVSATYSCSDVSSRHVAAGRISCQGKNSKDGRKPTAGSMAVNGTERLYGISILTCRTYTPAVYYVIRIVVVAIIPIMEWQHNTATHDLSVRPQWKEGGGGQKSGTKQL